MAVVLSRLGLVASLSALALSSFACGGRADMDGPGAGSGGQPPAGEGGQSGNTQGGRAQGGMPVTAGGRASGGRTASGGSAQGGSTAGGCVHQGKSYTVGETFAAGDGCNTCSCSVSGPVCTQRECTVCPDLDGEYATLLAQAKLCNPTLSSEQCQQPISAGLVCRCDTFVNPSQATALERMKQIQAEHAMNRCAEDVVCSPCQAPTHAYCSAEGRCEDRYDELRRCMVAGKVFPHGTTGIPDPASCNTCSCQNGQLICTEIGCPSTCPAGTAAGVQCAECGPVDACLLPDYECFPTCTDTCPQANQRCIGGLCKSGYCG